MSVNDDFLEVYFNLLDDEQRGPWIKSTDNMYTDAVKSPSKRKGYMKIQDELLLGNVDEAYTMATDLKDNGKKHTVVVANGDCMFNAILSCIEHPVKYTASVFRKQIVSFALHNVQWFKDKIVCEGQSFESYLRNVSQGLCYGDRNVLQIVSMLWKIQITILNPFEPPDHIWHNEGTKGAHILLCWNGHNHYSGTINTEGPNVRLQPIRNVIHYKSKSSIKLPARMLQKKAEVEKIREELKSLNETPVIKQEPFSDKDENRNIKDLCNENVAVAESSVEVVDASSSKEVVTDTSKVKERIGSSSSSEIGVGNSSETKVVAGSSESGSSENKVVGSSESGLSQTKVVAGADSSQTKVVAGSSELDSSESKVVADSSESEMLTVDLSESKAVAASLATSESEHVKQDSSNSEKIDITEKDDVSSCPEITQTVDSSQAENVAEVDVSSCQDNTKTADSVQENNFSIVVADVHRVDIVTPSKDVDSSAVSLDKDSSLKHCSSSEEEVEHETHVPIDVDSSRESTIIYRPENEINKEAAEAAVKALALVDYEASGDEKGGRLNPEGMEMTTFPTYRPECSDISEPETENMHKAKNINGGRESADSTLALADTAIASVIRRKRSSSGEYKKNLSKKKKKDSSLTSKVKQYQSLKSELDELEKFVAAGKIAEKKVRISLLKCGATESDLEEDVPPSGLRKNLFEQFDYNEDECAPNTTTNNEYKESEEISNFEADTMIMDGEYKPLDESSKLVENKRPEKISGIFKDNQSVIIKKSCYDEKT